MSNRRSPETGSWQGRAGAVQDTPAATADDAPEQGEERPTVASWVRWGGPATVAVAALLYLAMYLHWPLFFLQIDALVYRFGGQQVWRGLDLYATGFNGRTDDLLFTYTPFAALCFLPLNALSRQLIEILCLPTMLVLLTYTVSRTLRWFGLTTATGLWGLTALLAALLAWLEPVRLSVQLGQINLVILAVVVADLLGPRQRKWAGIGIGLVAGIKLTPAIFILYLVATGRLRAAGVAIATFVATVLIGFAVLPSASAYYWLHHHFGDVQRISHDPSGTTSVRGVFLRLHDATPLATAAALLLVIAGLAVAALAYRRGQDVLAIAIVGMASAAASPFSWSHHWVWFVPLVVHLGYRAYVLGSTSSAWTMWLLCALFASWFTSLAGNSPTPGLLSLRLGGVLGAIVPSTYVLAFLTVLASTTAWLWRSSAGAGPTAPSRPRSAWLTGVGGTRDDRPH